MNPRFHLQTYQVTCQGCSIQTKVSGLGDTPEASELKAHQQLEDKNWTDGLCPDCAEKKFLE